MHGALTEGGRCGSKVWEVRGVSVANVTLDVLQASAFRLRLAAEIVNLRLLFAEIFQAFKVSCDQRFLLCAGPADVETVIGTAQDVDVMHENPCPSTAPCGRVLGAPFDSIVGWRLGWVRTGPP